ncbi:MAG: FHA domain-containing protein [Pseudomonadota bacterium]|nr:FHA domain-containing protein [Pseudomonadota bacterium]
MAKLIVTSKGNLVGEFPLGRECITVGRKSDNDIHIENPSISGYHAQVITILNESFIEDLNSTNGTFVNSRMVRKHALHNGDVISLGQHKLEYVNELTAKDAAQVVDRTMVIGGDAKVAAKQRMTATQAKAQELANARVRITSGSNEGKELLLTKPVTTLGQPGVVVAAISRKDDGFYIMLVEGDDEQKHPQVNGETIDQDARLLNPGDNINIGGIRMRFLAGSLTSS